MLRAVFWVSLLSGLAALALAAAASLHIPITKFPTSWEIEKVERLVAERGHFGVADAQSLQDSLGSIRANDARAYKVLLSLRQLALLGFLGLAAGGFVSAYLSFGLMRTLPTEAPGNES